MESPSRELLRSSDFLRLWLVGAFANAMRWLELLASGLFAWEVTHSALAVTAVVAARQLPQLLFGAFAGAVSEAVNRKLIVMAALLVPALVSTLLASLAVLCDGDLRRALNALEVLVLGLAEGAPITPAELAVFARERRIRYDADEDEHHDTISAFIKSCRGSDPDAAMYWLAKMLAGGEDPRFIARRLVILASEDVGLADPQALPLTVAAHHACDFIGLPEAELTLAHATLYIATAPKSNSANLALGEAHRALKESPVQTIPSALRSKSGQANQRIAQGKDYDYSHDFPENISGQNYLEKPLTLYTPKTAGWESKIADRLARWRELKKHLRANPERAETD